MKRGMTWLQELAAKNRGREPEAIDHQEVKAELESEIKKIETRQQKWKRLNPEKVKAAQAKLMRERRAKEKAAKSDSSNYKEPPENSRK